MRSIVLKQQEYGMNKQVTHLFVIPLEILINLKKINHFKSLLFYLQVYVLLYTILSLINCQSLHFFPLFV